MDFIAVYPKIEPRLNLKLLFRKFSSLSLFLSCLVCGIVNLCVGKTPWSLYVFGGVLVFWAIFLYHPLVEYSLIRKITTVLLCVCAYLICIDWLGHGYHWSLLVVPIILFSVFFLTIVIFFLSFKKQKHNIFPLYQIFLLSLVAILCAACNLFSLTFSWPMIVLSALDGLLLILTLFFFRTPLLREFRKKFHNK